MQKWRLTTDGYIKRYKTNNKGSENYPRKKYSHLNDKAKLELVDKLNFVEGEKGKEKLEFKNSFIPQIVLEDYYTYLSTNHKSEKTTRDQRSAFINHGIGLLQSLFGPNPADWKKNETEWGKELIKLGLSREYIKKVIHSVNRFFKFASQKYDGQITRYDFAPVNKNQLRHHEVKRVEKLDKSGARNPNGNYIAKTDIALIFKKAPDDLLPYLKLMYWYGLRAAETCAVIVDIKKRVVKDGLIIDRQFIKLGDDIKSMKTALPKYDKIRKVGHVFRNVDLSELKETILRLEPMHVNTLEKRITKFTSSLKLSVATHYTSHDFRRTFITDAFDNGFNPTDIMDAVGHIDLKTTLKYRREKKTTNESIWDEI